MQITRFGKIGEKAVSGDGWPNQLSFPQANPGSGSGSGSGSICDSYLVYLSSSPYPAGGLLCMHSLDREAGI